MRTLHTTFTNLDDIRERMEAADEFETPVHILRDYVEGFCDTLANSPQLKDIHNTILFKTFLLWAIEFFKNAIDATAKKLEFEFKLDASANQMQIVARDDGKKAIPVEKLGDYRWQIPFEKVSEKAGGSKQMGGAHLGLARFAHVLHAHCDSGKLSLTQRNNQQPGAEVALTGSTASRWAYDTQSDDFNLLYLNEMHSDFKKTGAAETKTRVVTKLSEGALLSPIRAVDENPTGLTFSTPPIRTTKKTVKPVDLAPITLSEKAESLDSPSTAAHGPKTVKAVFGGVVSPAFFSPTKKSTPRHWLVPICPEPRVSAEPGL